MVISKKAIACIGESDEATSYAIYEILDRLGCRWYMPSDMGEVIPAMATIKLPKMDFSVVPPTIYRNIWYADKAYKRRNRLGGIYYNAAHALEGYITKEQRKEHPDWNAEFNGKRLPEYHRICWGNPEVANGVADGVLKMLEKRHTPCVSLSPGDGMTFCQCAKCKSFDTGDWDPNTQQTSITDRYIQFCNRIAEKVTKKYPDMLFGILAYEQYTRAPLREKLHPNLVPLLAPILYCRSHSLTNSDCPSRVRLRGIVKGWGKTVQGIAIDDYAYHLAEVTCPFPLITKWSKDLPIYYANKMTLWKPETMPTFEASLPGLYLGIRMSWYSESKPADILDEFFTNFYGASAGTMRKYWTAMDDVWTKVPEHAGCRWGHQRRFTPEVMKAARGTINEALDACKTVMEYRRVKIVDDSFRQFELHMKLIWDFHAGRWLYLDKDSDRWAGGWDSLNHEYRPQSAFSHYGSIYFRRLSQLIFKDAARVAKNFKIITRPIRKWQFMADKDKKGDSLGWSKVDFDDKGWKTTDPCVETWSAMGLYDYFGDAWYRTKVKAPAIPDSKKVYLWIGGLDSKCKLFMNGKHIPYVNKKGETVEQFSGYAMPAMFDVTKALKPKAENQITIKTNRNAGWINEIGTGGLLGPVVLYHEK